ncbi:MAG: glycine--tRNA ligase [Phycisphaerae bacterium]
MAKDQQTNDLMEKLVSLCKRRGFIFPGSEIYGGLNGFWDYGPLGVELKRNVKDAWWSDMVTGRIDMVGLDSAIIMNPHVWVASGHESGFTDPMVDCKDCGGRFRADDLTTPCPKNKNKLHSDLPDHMTPSRQFNMMFKTFVGAMEESSSQAYLRPETAQGIFVNFNNVLQTSRLKIPFGIAQIGKSFRNEINPRNFTFRSREFEQMEIEFFVHPSEGEKFYEYWRHLRYQWYIDLGLGKDRLHLRPHAKEELAHYAAGCSDIEYDFPFGTSELEGIANRTDFDLKRHMEFSGKDLMYFDDQSREKYIPHVVEPSAGVDRAALAFLCEAYHEEVVKDETRVVMKFHPRIAPIKAAILPLVNRDGMPEKAQKIFNHVRKHFNVFYDDKGAIGRRYRRQDEAGTPFGFTIDGQTVQDDTVTVRDRDTMTQERISTDKIVDYLHDKLHLDT